MSKLRRYYNLGSTFFITSVTYNRRPILVQNIDLFENALTRSREKQGINTIAWVVLPDHIHIVMEVGKNNLSQVTKYLKESFAFWYRSRLGTKSRRVWQHRFWDHVIRNQEDLNRHIDYIHYNPVKHGLCRSPAKYSESSFGIYLERGVYDADWGVDEVRAFEGNFGE